MTDVVIYTGTGIGLWLLGLLGLMLVRHLLRRIIAINLMSSGVFLVLVAAAQTGERTDPVLHALVVTGLVVAISATAFAVRLGNAVRQQDAAGGGGTQGGQQ